MVKLRSDHKLLKSSRELYMIDTENCGYPEMSYHSDTAYRVSCEYYSRSFGIMYCEDKGESLMYAAVNMGWENTCLALPRPPKGFDWSIKYSTDPEAFGKALTQELEKTIPGRTVTIFETVKTPSGKKTGKKVK
jgi:glycogen operon protein